MKLGINGRFLSQPVTGVQRFAREVCTRLLDLGPEPSVVLFLPRGAEAPSEMGEGVRVVHGLASGQVWEQTELPVEATQAKVDVLLGLANTGPAWGPPAVLTVHDVLPISNPEWFTTAFAKWYSLVVAKAVRRAATVLTASEWSKREINAWLQIPQDQITVVSQGIAPFDGPASKSQVLAVRRRFGLPADYVLASGAGDPRKGHDFLADVLVRWRSRGSGLPLVTFGSAAKNVHPGADPDEAGAAGGRTAELIPLGTVTDDDLRALYTGATVFCFPSRAEGFGRPPLEALACGTPSLVAAYGAAEEVLGRSALIRPLEVDAWVDALTRLASEPPDASVLVEIAALLRTKYSWERAATQVVDACVAAAAKTDHGSHGPPSSRSEEG